ncbi:MAG: type II secretion system protein GspG [Terriglobia bacterium]|nr:MAG: type II secretion system protein GspG [Terriglobia bacterium]
MKISSRTLKRAKNRLLARAAQKRVFAGTCRAATVRERWPHSRQSGITLIEMLVVMTIIALFVALVAPSMFKKSDAARITAARAQIHNFQTALGAYKLDTGTFPTAEQGGLQALRVKPSEVNQWAGPYMPQDIPKDPWGHDYAYKYPGDHGDEPDIISYGGDGQAGGEGLNADIVSWKNQ